MPVAVRFGSGLLNSFRPETPAVVLADPGAVSRALCEQIKTRWGANLLDWVWQDQGECEINRLERLAQPVWKALQQSPATKLVAIGGGSTLDCAKILRWRAPLSQDESTWRSIWLSEGTGTQLTQWTRHPLTCWPTTSGTGSEVSASATLWDRQSSPAKKLAWQPPQGFADEAFIDPELTVSCPASVTRDCALDAMSHGLETLWNKRNSFLSSTLAQRAVSLVIQNLPILLNDLTNLSARKRLSEASVLAGIAMSETQTALAHALSYDLTLAEKIPHGHAVAVWLPLVAQLTCQDNPELRQILQNALGTNESPCQFLETWLNQLQVTPRSVTDLPNKGESLTEALLSPRGRNTLLGSTHVV